MHPLFTKYGQYALFPVISGSANGTFVGGYTVSLFEAAINNYTHLLSGVAPGLFATEGDAREAALVAAREAADGLSLA